MADIERHPTLALAAPCDDPALIPLWLDFDGEDAAERALSAARRIVGVGASPVFVVQHHERGAHLLAPTLVKWERFVKLARSLGADMTAAEIAVKRGQPFLRVSARPYDKPAAIWIAMIGTRGDPVVASLIPEQIAAVGAYLAAIKPGTLAATYLQARPEGGR